MYIEFTVASVKVEKRKTKTTSVSLGGPDGVHFGKEREVDDHTQVITSDTGKTYFRWFYERKPERVYQGQILRCFVESAPNGHGHIKIRDMYSKEKFREKVEFAIKRRKEEVERFCAEIAQLETLLKE